MKKRNPEGTIKPVTTTCLDVGIFGVPTLYMFVFLFSSILSLGLSGYFYCVCLLFIIANNDILKRVLRAVTKNGKCCCQCSENMQVSFSSFFCCHRYFIDLGCYSGPHCPVHLCCHLICLLAQLFPNHG